MRPNRSTIGGGAPCDVALLGSFFYRMDIQKHHFPATRDFAVGSRADIADLDYIPVTPVGVASWRTARTRGLMAALS